jgi:hypothetical protein
LRLGLDNFRTNPVDCPYTTAGGDDDKLTYNSMKQVPEIGPGIKDILCNYDKDWIAIIVNIFYNKNGEIYFYMSTSSDDNQYGYHANKDEVKGESVSTCFVLFALKNESDYAIIGIAGGSFGQTVKPSYTSGRKISSEFPQLSNIEDSSTITDIKAKFSNIYKLSEYTGNGKEVNTYSNIVYWNNYTANCNLDIPIETVGYQLKVNDIALLTNSEINNFKYTGITKYEVKSSISHYINFDKVV